MIKDILMKITPDYLLQKYRYVRIAQEEKKKVRAEKERFDVLFKKWSNHETVLDWKRKGWINDKDLDAFYLNSWETNYEKFSEPVPNPAKAKYHYIGSQAKKFNVSSIVETGTYLGGMIETLLDSFENIYSIEIDDKLYNRAVDKFKNNKHVHLFHGDSTYKLKELILTLNSPAIFWLDGHYSYGITGKGDTNCPIYPELEAIFLNQNKIKHVVLIDDIRCFNGTDSYPTLQELRYFIMEKIPNANIEIKHDIMTISYQ